MNREFLTKLIYQKEKRDSKDKWPGKNRDTVQVCSNGVRYIKAHLKLNPARDTKGNIKGTGISAI